MNLNEVPKKNFFYFNDEAIKNAANDNKIDIVYGLLLKKDKICDKLFYECDELNLISIPN